MGFQLCCVGVLSRALDKCKSVVQIYSPHVHAYRTTPNALTTTVKEITSDNTSHPPTKISRMGVINWLVQMTSQPTLLYSCPGINPVPYNNPPQYQVVTKVCHTVNTTLFPLTISSMIQMAECDIFLSISTRVEMMGILLIKNYFDTLLRNHLSSTVYVLDNISTALCILCHK